MAMKSISFVTALLLSLLTTAAAGTTPQAYSAELSVPFGVVTGQLVPSGDYLIFIDQEQPQFSFVIPRRELKDIRPESGALIVALSTPIRDRSGERSRLSFRMGSGADEQAVIQWSKNTTSAMASHVTPDPAVPLFSYQAKHDHRFGSCNGRLIITPDRIAYESVSDINHSRQWAMKDIKEVERDNPYKLKIKPFEGDNYTFQLMGNGMDSKDYESLVKLITAARTSS
jgi:hypothetical protein